MRRQGQYIDSSGDGYVAAQMHHHAHDPRTDNTQSSQFEGRLEAFTPERDAPFGSSKADGQWRWERDGSKVPNSANTPQMFNEGQVGEAARPYFQGHRPDPKMNLDKQSNSDTRSQPQNEDIAIVFEENNLPQTFQGIEQKFRDDILKLVNEQNDAEDAEITRHTEKINGIHARYEEQLAAVRARHGNSRDEFLHRESSTRQQKYQQVVVDCYTDGNAIGPNESHSYTGLAAASAPPADAHRSYNNEQYDSYRERARFLGGPRDHGFEPRGPYPRGRVYDTGSRYY